MYWIALLPLAVLSLGVDASLAFSHSARRLLPLSKPLGLSSHRTLGTTSSLLPRRRPSLRLRSSAGDPEEDAYPSDYGDFGDSIPKLNSVTLVGRIGQTPNPRYFDNGNVVVNVSLAVTRKYHPLERKVRSIPYGQEETDWFPLEIWGRDAEYCAKVRRLS